MYWLFSLVWSESQLKKSCFFVIKHFFLAFYTKLTNESVLEYFFMVNGHLTFSRNGQRIKHVFFVFMALLKYWMLDVSRTASFDEITLVSSVHPSVCLSLSFLKIGSLDFSDILHDDSWPWYLLVTDKVVFLKKKKNGSPNLGQMGQIWAQN